MVPEQLVKMRASFTLLISRLIFRAFGLAFSHPPGQEDGHRSAAGGDALEGEVARCPQRLGSDRRSPADRGLPTSVATVYTHGMVLESCWGGRFQKRHVFFD